MQRWNQNEDQMEQLNVPILLKDWMLLGKESRLRLIETNLESCKILMKSGIRADDIVGAGCITITVCV